MRSPDSSFELGGQGFSVTEYSTQGEQQVQKCGGPNCKDIFMGLRRVGGKMCVGGDKVEKMLRR